MGLARALGDRQRQHLRRLLDRAASSGNPSGRLTFQPSSFCVQGKDRWEAEWDEFL